MLDPRSHFSATPGTGLTPSQVRTRVKLFRKSPESIHLAGTSQPAAASGLPSERTTTTASVATLRFVSMRNISFLLPGIARRRHDADRPRDRPQALLVCPEVVSIGAFCGPTDKRRAQAELRASRHLFSPPGI